MVMNSLMTFMMMDLFDDDNDGSSFDDDDDLDYDPTAKMGI